MKTELTPDTEDLFGLRWQNEAATPLFSRSGSIPKRRGAALPAAVQKLAPLLLCILALIPSASFAATNDLSGLLQKGLFEEEANRNLDVAAQAYQIVSAQFDKDRGLAATAIFRLGEIYRKQNKTNEAAAQYERIVREFPDQQALATLSRQNLAGIGANSEAAVPTGLPMATRLEQKRLLEEEIKLVEQDVAELRRQKDAGVVPPTTVRAKEREVLKLRQQIAALNIDAADTTADASADAPVTDDEEKEIRRIQEMIKNSPDLINASRGEEGTPLFQAATKGQLQVAGFLLEHGAAVNALAGSHGNIWDSWTPLIAAANGGHKAMVELLLDRGAEVDAKAQNGNTALLLAAKNGFGGVAESLLARKANVNLGDQDGITPLQVAAGAGHSAMMDLLLRNGADVNTADKSGQTPLMQASWYGHSEAVRTLLAAKADASRQNNSGRTALSFGAVGHLEVVKALLEAKADPNAGKLDLPLVIAAQSGRAEIAELLLRAGAKPDLATKTSQNFGPPGNGPFGPYTPLQIAASRKDTPMVKVLLKFKADANAKDPSYPARPLVGYALGEPEMLQAFLEAGADANADREEGWPLLVLASASSNARAVELLLAHGAKTELPSREGRTPLSYAAQNNCVQCVQLLLEAKADANATAPDGTTALHWAVSNGSKDMVEALIAHGAEVNGQNQRGETPLHLAIQIGGHGIGAEKMAELLLSKGADPNIRNNAGLTPLDLAKGKGLPPQPGMLPPQGSPMRPQQSATEIAAVLREHGALDDLPDFNSIRVTHAGWTPFVVFLKDTNSVNQFTLLEVILNFYGNPQVGSGIAFPDFSKIIIDRPIAGKPGAKQEITVNLLTVTNSFDCAKDTRLEFGDVVEIPEREHTLAEQAVGLAANQREQLSRCLEGKVTFVVRGQKAELELDGTANTCRLQLALGRVQNLLRSSSDLSHIRIKRTDPATGKTTEIVADSKLTQQENVWLRDGDVIEVPDK